jgi:hypothetical protein
MIIADRLVGADGPAHGIVRKRQSEALGRGFPGEEAPPGKGPGMTLNRLQQEPQREALGQAGQPKPCSFGNAFLEGIATCPPARLLFIRPSRPRRLADRFTKS